MSTSRKSRCDVFIVAFVNSSVFADPLLAGVTPVKAVHITELRSRIDAPISW